ncbi:MAG: Fic family protein [Candidatus Omnitrophica bacterium]|nr:Fic family protein [Candidatus Omnitrophota bacterium]
MKKQKIFKLKGTIENLKKQGLGIITVSNGEWYSLLKDEIRNSIAIEGVFANRNELLDVLEKNKKTDKQKTASILGYFESASSVYEYANNQFKEKEFLLKISDIKQIHSLLMKYEKKFGSYTGTIGDFRNSDIEVAKANFKPISHFYVREAVELLVKWVNWKLKEKNFDVLKLAVASHVWFETIHPFRDGNGRVGRILLSYILIGSGLVNISIKGIAKSDREKYYKVLEAADDCFEKINRDLEKGIKISLSELDQYIEKQDFSAVENMALSCLEKSVNRLKLTRGLSLEPDAILPLRKLAVAFDYSPDYLRNLINRGKIKATKRGKLWYIRLGDMQDYINSVHE